MSENLQDSVNKAVSASSVSNSTSNNTSNVKPTMNNPQILKHSYQEPQMNKPQFMMEYLTADSLAKYKSNNSDKEDK